MASHADFHSIIPDVLGMYGLWPYGEPEPVAGGSLNWNFRVQTDGGEYFLRRYRDDLETPRIRGEHALVKWAVERGIPAPLPETVPERGTIAEIAGGRWALFPWVDGEVRPRGALTPAQARSLGTAHGATQATLAGYVDPTEHPIRQRWDKEESLRYLPRVIEVARGRGEEQWILDALQQQLRMLESWDVLPPAAFAGLPAQVLHGDFHDQQILWDGDNVVAIVDWEIWHTDWRVWELVRSLAFSKLLDSPLLEDYLAGYRDFVSLSEEECRLGLRLWWQSRVVGLWAWAAHYLQGNERVREFFPAMVEGLDRVADDGWKAGIEERFIRAACG